MIYNIKTHILPIIYIYISYTLQAFCGQVKEYWHNMSMGLDTTTELPPERWDMDAYYDPDVDAPGKTYVRLGHFIPGTEALNSSKLP